MGPELLGEESRSRCRERVDRRLGGHAHTWRLEKGDVRWPGEPSVYCDDGS